EYRAKQVEQREEPLRVLADRAAKWQERVSTAKALATAGVRFAFATDGLTKADTFHAQVRKAIVAGLPHEDAVKALTESAAEIAGVGDRLGSIAPGKLGHLIVLSGPYGNESTQVRYVFAEGLKFDLKDATSKGSGQAKEKGKRGRGRPDESEPKPKSDDATPPAEKADPPKLEQPKADQPKTEQPKAEQPKAEQAKAPAEEPKAKAEVAKKADEAKQAADESKDKTKPDDDAASEKKSDAQATAAAAQAKREQKPEAPAQGQPAAASPEAKPQDQKPASKDAFVDIASELDEDRKPAASFHTGGNVLIKDATILTVSPKGTIPKGSILIRGGKIVEVGPSIEAPQGVMVIDAAGLVAMPGIIDTHSHMAMQGGVNEMSLSIVPEVQVRDVVIGDDLTIYRALAGGTTTARLLHGSANTIGGQDVVIKLRYGQPGRDLIIHEGPQGVKFALGENVTRRNGRFPNTRMGVEATIERAFEEANAYRAEQAAHNAAVAKGTPTPPLRRDLRLEALAGILEHRIKIHCHCYRNDEILMLLNIASRHDVRVQSLQHVLEGYKVAAEIHAHGASTSTFSDWWAYKIEAYDAIPYNSALLAEAGVPVCIKSDDNELVRHLNLEAAKMIKYGGVSEAQALEMITLNPARQLGLDHRLGSIEPNKDADIVLFNAHPFDGFSRCELALIDGEVWFQRRDPDGKLAPRPGEHATAPLASEESRKRPLEIAASPNRTYALTGATIHPVSGPDIPGGTIVISKGKITAIGGAETVVEAGAQSFDLHGLDIWPGMIDAGSVLGLFEVGSLPETQDYSDSAQFQPELHTSTALHPDSEIIPVTRANGVLSTYVQPSGGSISG
ncbi:MAG TPA: amidohydrolase family protein, partial [Isosphaeraceae bacterium]|nr:amidohydrolase family protein [Isosphaeraceae bacterium]